MSKAARVTVVLDEDLSAAVERARKHTGQSRSAFIRDAVATAVEQGHSQEEVERYLQGYRAMPESDEDIKEATALGYAALAEEPWE